jgi:hypothetical protein
MYANLIKVNQVVPQLDNGPKEGAWPALKKMSLRIRQALSLFVQPVA